MLKAKGARKKESIKFIGLRNSVSTVNNQIDFPLFREEAHNGILDI